MKKQRSIWVYLAIVAVLACYGRGSFPGARADKEETSRSIPPEVAKAWTDAGARVGWIKDVPPEATGGYQYWKPFREKDEPGAVPAFHFHPKEKGSLAKLPNPGVPFGLDTHCGGLADADLKELARFKSLQSLNLGADLGLKDVRLRALTQLKNLQGLYLFYTPVTDAGLKELAVLKELRALDLSHTQVRGTGLKELAALKNLQALNLSYTKVTDAGLKDLAEMKSLRWLSLHQTMVTAAGIAGLQKELPECKILVKDD
jgi:hypothetical protein